MKPLLTSLLLLLAALLPAQEERAFRVGTWNLEFLGADGNFRNNLPLRTPADHAAIGRKIRELGVAVLAVQEINDEASLRAVAAGAGPTWDLVLGTTGLWDDGKTAQRIGFLYDRAQVDLLHAEELLELPREFEGQKIFHRVPVTACFRHLPTGCDFRLVTVHLKAGPKPADAHKRRGEALALSAWLDALQQRPGEDPDILLLGDFNSTYATEPQQLFERAGLRRYLPQPVASPTIQHFPEPIDQIVVGRGFAEVRPSTYAVDSDHDGMAPQAWRQIYSDHFPVTVELRAASDDDPDATFTRGPAAHWLPATLRTTAAPTTAAWPFVAGARVHVATPNGSYAGPLLFAVPQDGHGFVVLATADGTVAVACAQVLAMHLRP
jgi:endonuclease/exonuclease/phosphatase family metal-dependent hydrolase